MKVIFVRHGQTDYNKHGILAGQLNPPLNNNGRFQATKVGIALAGVKFDKVYCSDLKRAEQTCRIILSQNDHFNEITLSEVDSLVIEDTILREQHFGDFEGKKVKSIKEKQKADKNFLPAGGESKEDVTNRASQFFENMCDAELSKLDHEKVVLVVSHGIFLNLLFKYFNSKYECHGEYLNERILNASRSFFEITTANEGLHMQCQYYNKIDYKNAVAYYWFMLKRFLIK